MIKRDRGTLNNIWQISTTRSPLQGFGAVFPEKLIEHILINFTKENQTILDPFMGTGTTGVVAKRLKRNFIGIELDKKTFQFAKKRIKN